MEMLRLSLFYVFVDFKFCSLCLHKVSIYKKKGAKVKIKDKAI